MIKCGIIGFGKMGQIRAEALEVTGRGEVIKIYEPTDAFHPHAEKTSTPQDIINSEEIDAIFICTPNHLNKPLTIEALKAGKHVFCEKPPAFTAEEVREIQQAEKASGKKLMYGFNHRHHESIIQMKKLVDEKVYGKVIWMRGRYGKSVDSDYLKGWRANKKLAGGGILLDQGIHMLDLFLYLGGDFDEIQAMVSSLYWKIEGIEDNVFANFRNTKTGLVASLHSTMTQWRHLFSLEVFLEKGYMVLNGLKTSSGSYGDEELTIARNRTKAPAAIWSDEEKTVFGVDNSWTNEMNHFLDCVENDTDILLGSSHDALKLMTLIDRIYNNTAHVKEELYDDLIS